MNRQNSRNAEKKVKNKKKKLFFGTPKSSNFDCFQEIELDSNEPRNKFLAENEPNILSAEDFQFLSSGDYIEMSFSSDSENIKIGIEIANEHEQVDEEVNENVEVDAKEEKIEGNVSDIYTVFNRKI